MLEAHPTVAGPIERASDPMLRLIPLRAPRMAEDGAEALSASMLRLDAEARSAEGPTYG